MTKKGEIAYIGDFDFRNENVQSFLVRNNGKILNGLGYKVHYIGVNRNKSSFSTVCEPPALKLDANNSYLELPHTLNIKGILKIPAICKIIIDYLEKMRTEGNLKYVITYQSPSYSYVVGKVAKWCKNNSIPYIVNCADIPIFKQQPLYRRIIMKPNWDYLHRVNRKYANGIISVSKYIESFYKKDNCKYVIIPPLFDSGVKTHGISKRKKETTFVYAGCPFKSGKGAVDKSAMKDRLDLVIDLFLELQKQNIPFSLKIAGISKADYLIGVPRHKNALCEPSSIEFLGRISHEDTVELVADSDFSVSYRDENVMTKAGFPTKVVESISVGTPMIINDISDVQHYLSEGVSCFTLGENFLENVEKLRRLCFLPPDKRYNLKLDVMKEKTFDISNYNKKFAVFLNSI